MSPFPCRRPGRRRARPAHERSRDGTAVPPDVREQPKRNDGRGVRVRAGDVTRGMTAAQVREDLPVTGPGGSDGVTACVLWSWP